MLERSTDAKDEDSREGAKMQRGTYLVIDKRSCLSEKSCGFADLVAASLLAVASDKIIRYL
jgi:hypothetical protein